MKNLKKLYIAFLATFLVVACNVAPIEVSQFTGYSTIKENEKAKIYWEFKNADGVIVDGYSQKFAANDSLELEPKAYTKLNVMAFRNNLDTVTMTSIIDVIQDENINKKSAETIKSKEKSEYFLHQIDEGRDIAKIKFMGYKFDKSNGAFNIKAIAIDEFGNNASNNEIYDIFLKNITFKNKEDDLMVIPELGKIKTIEKPLNFTFLFDNSLQVPEEFRSDLVIKSFSNIMEENDKVSYYDYNMNLNPIAQNQNKYKIIPAAESYIPAAKEPLNSLYKSAYKTLSAIGKAEKDDKVFVIVTYSTDNSSIIFTANDITKLAKDFNIPIYIIAIGDGLLTYTLRYISSATGGKFYHIANDETPSINNILTEIYNAQKSYYEIKVNFGENIKDIQKITGTLNYEQNGKEYFDKVYLINKDQTQYIPYQSLATFDFKSNSYHSKYDDNLKSLVDVLKDNPDSKIELIGNSGLEGNPAITDKISNERAEAVKGSLIRLGANANQIKIKNLGNKKPLFLMETEVWQGYLNRRVDIKWLDPSILPYEIVGKAHNSETDALKSMEYWENKGFKAYFDRVMINDSPSYRLKIWGFATEEEAQSSIKRIKKEYKETFVID